MNSQETLQRLLQIAMYLLNDSCTIEDLQQKTKIEKRSIYRYVNTLKEAGFGINKTGTYYSIVKLPKEIDEIKNSLYFSQEEQYMLYCAIEGIQFSTSPLKEVLKKKLNVIYDYKMLPKPIINELYGNNFHLLAEAIQQKKQVKLQRYHSANSNTVTDRWVEPFAFTPNNYDVWCLDLQDKQSKTFRISRVEKVVASKKYWEHERLHKQNPVDIFRMSAPQQNIPVKLKLTTRAADLLKEEYPFAKEYLHSTESGNQWILTTNVCDIKGVGRFVMSLLNEIEIINSPELEKYIREQILQYLHKEQKIKYKEHFFHFF